ncbi:gamma-glutamylcyclotransferase [Cohnella sp. AR92]|uniref:gamma-glutamylcyclotransferase family protein n=1 Tax=Cohnella sp. AR92 TaxID=648716 RepID=UPI001315952B|nr:gamma-glutamylcyclotransferase family protein [Cohnella sp. AR92]
MRLFVYGTLLPQFQASRMISAYVSDAYEGRVRGKLVDAGSYPALIPACWEDTKEKNILIPECGGGSEAASVLIPAYGERSKDESAFVRGLWVEITREGLAVADRYEEFYGIEELNDYERIWISDADRPEVSGWVYAWPNARGYPDAGTDWWPNKQGMQDMVDKLDKKKDKQDMVDKLD